MLKWIFTITAIAIASLGWQCVKKQEFVFQPRPGLELRCKMKGVRRTTYEGTPSAILNFDLRFEKTGDDTVYFLFDSLYVACNGEKSTKTSCRTASVAVVSHREMVPKGECLYPLFSVFPESANLTPVTEFSLIKDGLFDEPY